MAVAVTVRQRATTCHPALEDAVHAAGIHQQLGAGRTTLSLRSAELSVKRKPVTSVTRFPAETVAQHVPEDLQEQLTDYLERASSALERDEQERARRDRHDAIQRRVVELGTWLVLLVGYSILVGFLSSSVLVASLIDPAAIGDRGAAFGNFLKAYGDTIPGDLRGIIVSLLSAQVVIVLRVVSLRSRSALGGIFFVGFAALSLLGLAAASTSGTVGLLIAVPGFIAVFAIIYEFLRFLRETLADVSLPAEVATRSQTMVHRTMRQLHSFRDSLLPGGNARRIALFVIVPIVAVLLVWAAASTNSHGGVLYWMSRISQIAFLVWCAWACSATPAATRIALWSLPGWGALILTLFTYGPVAIVFALAILTILFVNVFIAVLPERGSRNAV